ncbi:chromate resistance protein ChrB domain-containing protein [Dyella koreensis]|uniref:Chromate resistance protein n=2 Tax=Dyella koreensis TaxID=311235 RepID=A0ABW8KAY9_9GAMM
MSVNPATWLMLVASLTGRSPGPRMRLWRALKAAGAEALRDGVYVLPASEAAQALFRAQADEVIQAGGSAQVVPFSAADPKQESELRAAFDRTPVYAEGLDRLTSLMTELPGLSEIEGRRRLVTLRRDLEGIVATDFFPGPARDRVEIALRDAEQTLNAQFSPDEPHAAKGAISRRELADYRGRVWATRQHLWIDRVASAWLIRRFIDPEAHFLWLAKPADCPTDALGFDFDGATFTHVGQRVSFEVLATSFGLDGDPSLVRLGRLVRYLDIGGVPVADAAGFASVMTGARARRGDDDDGLLHDMATVLDCLYAAYLDTPGEPT